VTTARLAAVLGVALHLSLGCRAREAFLVSTDFHSHAPGIESLHFDDDCAGWAIASGSLHRTIDGGRTWKAISVGPRSYLSFVARDGMGRLWVGGSEGSEAATESDVGPEPERETRRSVVFESTDNGTSWRRTRVGVGNGVHARAACGRVLWVMGRDFMARSDDGGQGWTAVLAAQTAELSAIACDGDQTAMAATTKGTIHITHDGGRSWQRRTVAGGQFLSGIARSGRDWWAVGFKGVFTSGDGGQTWRRRETAGASMYALKTRDEHGLMVGADGSILAMNSGEWRRLSEVTHAGLIAIAISEDGRRAWVGGENMTVVRVGETSTSCLGQLPDETVYIWIPLLNGGSRPTKAEVVGGGLYRVLAAPDRDPQREKWAYLPGSVVLGERTTSDHGQRYLLATALVAP
jgi:photosystem II stability/assembly factor-like uncharacterized protein